MLQPADIQLLFEDAVVSHASTAAAAAATTALAALAAAAALASASAAAAAPAPAAAAAAAAAAVVSASPVFFTFVTFLCSSSYSSNQLLVWYTTLNIGSRALEDKEKT